MITYRYITKMIKSALISAIEHRIILSLIRYGISMALIPAKIEHLE